MVNKIICPKCTEDSKFMSQTFFFKMQFTHLMVHLSIYISKKVIKFKQSFLVKILLQISCMIARFTNLGCVKILE